MSAGISFREFARRDGCSDKVVRRAVSEGKLKSLPDGSLDPELVGTGWRKGNRNVSPAADKPRTVRTKVSARPAPADVDVELESQAHGGALKRNRRRDDDDEEELEGDADEMIERLLGGEVLGLAHAELVKANALALRQMVNARRMAGALIEIELAERVLFEEARKVRDALLNFGAKAGPLIAAEIGAEPDRVVEALNKHVHQLLEDLGEPTADFAG